MFTLLGLRVSSLRRGHAYLLCIVPRLTHDPRRESIAWKIRSVVLYRETSYTSDFQAGPIRCTLTHENQKCIKVIVIVIVVIIVIVVVIVIVIVVIIVIVIVIVIVMIIIIIITVVMIIVIVINSNSNSN